MLSRECVLEDAAGAGACVVCLCLCLCVCVCVCAASVVAGAARDVVIRDLYADVC